jgi:hypothetical protein
MAMAFLLAVQAAAAPAPPILDPIDFDLAQLRPLASGLDRCAPRDGTEIVVCGVRPRGQDYPLAEMERLFATRPIVAEGRLIGNVTGRAYVESVELPNRMTSKRIMIGIGLPF